MRIALTGNPNSGKTTTFNALTGRNEHVGNWAGVTVDKKEALIKKNFYDGAEELVGIDLPDEMVEKVVDGVKAKITMDKVGDALGALGGLFGKK